MTLFSRRLPHVMTRTDLAELLAPTYAREVGISADLSMERLKRAFKSDRLANRVYDAVSTALAPVQGGRSEDQLMDALSKAVVKRSSKVGDVPRGPALAAVTVMINLEVGQGSDGMQAMLESDKGRQLLDQGFADIGNHLVGQLLG